MTQPRLAQLHQSGATDGQVPVWDDTAGIWVPATPTGGASTALVPLTTVDTAGDPALVWAGDNSLVMTEVPL